MVYHSNRVGQQRVVKPPATRGERGSLLSFTKETRITQHTQWNSTLPAALEDNRIAKPKLLTQASCLLLEALSCSLLSLPKTRGGRALFIGFWVRLH